jgi:hypothetical protein
MGYEWHNVKHHSWWMVFCMCLNFSCELNFNKFISWGCPPHWGSSVSIPYLLFRTLIASIYMLPNDEDSINWQQISEITIWSSLFYYYNLLSSSVMFCCRLNDYFHKIALWVSWLLSGPLKILKCPQLFRL